jgi:ribosome-binding protein aMBF1 (putative translation factor)
MGDVLDTYVSTFTEDERDELAAAAAAIDIAILLHRARERHGWSQATAVQLAGLHQRAVSRLERPEAKPQIEPVRRYLAALGFAEDISPS